jgi:ATP-dependent RNA helicase DDX42
MVLPTHSSKVQWLVEMLPVLSPLGRCLIFVSTRAECDNLCRIVEGSCGMSGSGGTGGDVPSTIVSIHGDKDQRERNSAISVFKRNERSILIATDVAARGLDIPDVMAVVNFDAAKNLDSHVHRVGRAGRLRKRGAVEEDGATAHDEHGQRGQQHQRGVAYTLLTERDANFAATLAESFDREGREVSSELAVLCQKSSRYGGGRVKHSKVGLGFGVTGNAARASSTGTAAHASHYGPSPSPGQSTVKRSRWN